METQNEKTESETEPVKKQYLFGMVTVDIVAVEGISKEKAWDEAVKIWKEDIVKFSKDGPRKMFTMSWAEGSELSTEQARNNVLASFLQLMKHIPPTPSVEAPRIIIPTEFENNGKPKVEGTIQQILRPPGT